MIRLIDCPEVTTFGVPREIGGISSLRLRHPLILAAGGVANSCLRNWLPRRRFCSGNSLSHCDVRIYNSIFPLTFAAVPFS